MSNPSPSSSSTPMPPPSPPSPPNSSNPSKCPDPDKPPGLQLRNPSNWYWVYQWSFEVFPPRPKWSVKDIPDMKGKVVLVTGGNSGIGRVTCKYLLLANARVYLAARSPQKAAEAIAALKEDTGKEDIHFLELDLADLGSVRRCAEEVLQRERRMHILFCNAGVMLPSSSSPKVTRDGYDLQFGTNLLGHAYLTMLLLPLLRETAKTSDPGSVRIVIDSSQVHTFCWWGGVDYSSLRPDQPPRLREEREEGKKEKKGWGMTSWGRYAQSKWALVVFAKELARRYGEEGVVAMALNPGIIRTDLLRHSRLARFLLGWVMHRPDPDGALTQLYAGTAPQAGYLHGQYLIPLGRIGLSRPDTYREEAGRQLWEWVEQQVKDLPPSLVHD